MLLNQVLIMSSDMEYLKAPKIKVKQSDELTFYEF